MISYLKIELTLLLFLIVFRLNAQESWEFIGPADIPVFSFGAKEPFLFTGGNCDEGGVFVTTDFGENWTQVNTGLPLDGTDIRDIEISDTSILAAITFRGLYEVIDPEFNWDLVIGPFYLLSHNIIVFADAPWNKILVGGTKLKGIAGVMVSEDGENWADMSNGLPVDGSVFSMLTRDSSIYVGTVSGVYQREPEASQWQPSNTGIATRYVFSLGQNDSFLFAGTDNHGIYRSTDGSTWLEKNTGLETDNTTYGSFAVYGSHVFASAKGIHRGVYQSDDYGDSWFDIGEGLPFTTDVHVLTIQGPYIFAGTDDGVYRRELSGITGIGEIQNDEFEDMNVSTFPNPSPGHLTLTIHEKNVSGISGHYEVSCINPIGQTVFNKKYYTEQGELETNLELSACPDGIYLLRIHHGHKFKYKKFIIGH